MKNDNLLIRRAEFADLVAIAEMLADDPLGSGREEISTPLANEYIEAFQAIDSDPNQFLAVAVDQELIVATLQLTFIPGISRKGSWRGQIEAVRVAPSHRNAGFGEDMFNWAIGMARSRGCKLVQLTTDKTRPDAHRFYERLGFQATHEGFKLAL